MPSGTCAGFEVPARMVAAARKFRLTHREIQTLAVLSRGDTWKAAAAALGISVETVRFHVRNVHRKVGAQNSVCALCKLVGW